MAMDKSPKLSSLAVIPSHIFIVFCLIFLCYIGPSWTTDADTFRTLFFRHSNQRLSAITAKYINNSTVDACADHCVKELDFQCKSFDYDNALRACLLFTVNMDDRDVHLINSNGKDHYETSYSKLFNRLPNHRLPVTTNRMVPGVTSESCARHCVLETYFKCRGFNYRAADKRCMLVENTPSTSTGAIFSEGVGYFQRHPDGPLENFINFGMGRMHPLANGMVHQKGRRGLSLDQCSQLCLDETTFTCASFDYVFEGVDSNCYLSKYIAAEVGGLVIDSSNVQHNHFEKIGESLRKFYATPYAVIPGNNLKTYNRVTPNRCAQYCIEEDSFVCRSFDYRITDASCMLSDLSGSDVGGLATEGGFEGDVHHFEMKPMLDCGGNLTETEGDIASPNWPRDYVHHETCTWTIKTTRYKVLHLTFTHFELGLQSSDACSSEDDRLVITEKGEEPYCVLPNTKTIDTKNNEVTLAFSTNGQVDAQGFRMFYSAEWTCNENFKSPGEFASPKWPLSYPSGKTCSWKITAPLDHRIQLTFTSFDLEQHSLGHCNEQFDHVKILDGGTVNSPPVGLYCGSLVRFSIRSSGQDLIVKFVSDHDPDNIRQGFHAKFTFELANNSFYDHGGFAGPGYKSPDKNPDVLEGSSGKTGAQAASGEDETIPLSQHHQYKTTMWAIVTVLLLLLVAAGISLFLMYRHYRGRSSREHIIIEQDGVMFPQKGTPTTNLCSVKPNNDFEAVPSTSLMSPEEEGATAAPPDSCTRLNNLQLGKYAKENMKNMNIHPKNVDEDYV